MILLPATVMVCAVLTKVLSSRMSEPLAGTAAGGLFQLLAVAPGLSALVFVQRFETTLESVTFCTWWTSVLPPVPAVNPMIILFGRVYPERSIEQSGTKLRLPPVAL